MTYKSVFLVQKHMYFSKLTLSKGVFKLKLNYKKSHIEIKV